MADYEVSVGIDATPAQAGERVVQRSLNEIKKNVGNLSQRLSDLGRSQRTIESVTRRFLDISRATAELGNRLERLGAANQAFSTLGRNLDNLSRSLGKNLDNMTRVNQAFNKANSELQALEGLAGRLQGQLDSLQGNFRDITSAVASMTRQLNGIGSTLPHNVRLIQQYSRMQMELRNLRAEAENLAKRLPNMGVEQASKAIEDYARKVHTANMNFVAFKKELADFKPPDLSTMRANGAFGVSNQGLMDAINRGVAMGSTQDRRALGGGELNNRALEQLNQHYREAERASDRMSEATLKVGRSFDHTKLSTQEYMQKLRTLEAGILGAVGANTRLVRSNELQERSSRTATSGLLRHSHALRGFSGLVWSTVGAVQAFTAAFAFREIAQGIMTLQQLEVGFQSVGGSISHANERMTFAREIAEKYGLSLEAVARGLMRFEAASVNTGFSTQEIYEIFENTSAAIRSLGLDTQATEGIFRAFEQIMSKGKIMAEELRLQLGDRLPGAFSIMAEAVGVTNAELDKMLERGEVTSDNLLRFTEVLRERVDNGGGLQAAVRSLPAELARLQTAFLESTDVIGQGGFTRAVTDGARSLTGFLRSAEGHVVLSSLGKAAEIAVDALTLLLKHLDLVVAAFGALTALQVYRWLFTATEGVVGLAKAWNALTLAMARNPFTALATGLAILATTLAAFEFGLGDVEDAQRKLTDTSRDLAEASEFTRQSLEDLDTINKQGKGSIGENIELNTEYAKTLQRLGIEAEEAGRLLRSFTVARLQERIEDIKGNLDEVKESFSDGIDDILSQVEKQRGTLKGLGKELDLGDFNQDAQAWLDVLKEFEAFAKGPTPENFEKLRASMGEFTKQNNVEIYRNLGNELFKIAESVLQASDQTKVYELSLKDLEAQMKNLQGNTLENIKRFEEYQQVISKAQQPDNLDRLNRRFQVSSEYLEELKKSLQQVYFDGGNVEVFKELIDQLVERMKELAPEVGKFAEGMDKADFDKITQKLQGQVIELANSKAALLEYEMRLDKANEMQIGVAVGLQMQLDALDEYKDALKDGNKVKTESAAKSADLAAWYQAEAAASLAVVAVLAELKKLAESGVDISPEMIQTRALEAYNDTLYKTYEGAKEHVTAAQKKIREEVTKTSVSNTNSFINEEARLRENIQAWTDASEATQNYYETIKRGKQNFSQNQADTLTQLKILSDQIKAYDKLTSKMDSAISAVETGEADSQVKRLIKLREVQDELTKSTAIMREEFEIMPAIAKERAALLEKLTHESARLKEADEARAKGLAYLATTYAKEAQEIQDKATALKLENQLTEAQMNHGENVRELTAKMNSEREIEALLLEKTNALLAANIDLKAAEKSGDAELIALAKARNAALSESYDKLIEQTKESGRLRQIQASIDDELAKPMGQMFSNLAGEIEDDFKEAFKTAFDEGEGFFDSMLEGMMNSFKDFLAELAYQALIKPIIIPVFQQMGTSMFGLSLGATNTALGLPANTPIGGGSNGFNLGNSPLFGQVASFLNTPINGAVAGPGPAAGSFRAAQEAGMPAGSSFTNSPTGMTWGQGLGAGLAGFSTGMMVGGFLGTKTQSNAVGGLSGAASGAAMGAMIGGPAGAVIGGIAGALGGILGTQKEQNHGVGTTFSPYSGAGTITSDKATSEQLQATKQLQESMRDFADQMARAGLGTGPDMMSFELSSKNESWFQIGNVRKSFGKDEDPEKLAVEMVKAFTSQLSNVSIEVATALANTQATTVEKLLEDINFATNFKDTIKALSDGFGMADEAVQGARDQIRNITADIKEFKARTAELGLDTVAAADATQKFVKQLIGLGGPATRSPMEEAVATLRAQMEELPELLKEVGLDVGLAAEYFNQGMKKLKKDFEDNLNIRFLNATGNGAVAQILQMMSNYDLALKDAAAVGTDAAMVTKVFNAELKNLISGLDAEQLKQIISAFDGLPEKFAKIALAQAEVEKAKQNLINAYKSEIEHQQEVAEKAREAAQNFRSFAEQLGNFRKSLLLDEEGPLDPRERYKMADNSLQGLFDRAIGGDQKAFEDFQEGANDFLEISRQLFGSSSAYFADLQLVTDMLSVLEGQANSRATVAEQQLAAAEAQIDKMETQINILQGTQEAVLSVEQAIRELSAAQRRLDNVAGSGNGSYNGVTASPSIFLSEAQKTEIDLLRNLLGDRIGETDLASLPGFANGGTTALGEIVRIHNDELLYTGPSARVFDAAETSNILDIVENAGRSEGGTDERVIEELRNMILEVAKGNAVAAAKLEEVVEQLERVGDKVEEQQGTLSRLVNQPSHNVVRRKL